MIKLPELLAPAGDIVALRAAIASGADAVYLGGPGFNARAHAPNFTLKQLAEAVEFSHLRGVKVYITVNTLIADSELSDAATYLKELYRIGVDAIITQDLGLAALASTLLPELPLHASTQMTIHNAQAANLLAKKGFTRIVLARELSAAELTSINNTTPLELEVFVHGALCISYSGQCLMSSLIGGRSGNRGCCAQPCRMPYTLVGPQKELKEGYLLSTQDLCLAEHLPTLIQSGVASLKIEGRMKRPEYVATVVRIYRGVLDRYAADPTTFSILAQEHEELIQIFNRGFSSGYLHGNPGSKLMSYQRPNNRGRLIGRAIRYDPMRQQMLLELKANLSVGDGIEIWVSQGGRAGTTVSKIEINNQSFPQAEAGQSIWIPVQGRIRPGDRVFKTHDAALMEKATKAGGKGNEPRPQAITMHATAKLNAPVSLTISDLLGNTVKVNSELKCQAAQKHPLTEEKLTQHLLRLGDTPYRVTELKLDVEPGLMLPWSSINELRRQAIAALGAKRYRVRKVPKDFDQKADALICFPNEKHQSGKPIIAATAASQACVEAAIGGGAELLYLEATSWRHLPPFDLAAAANYCHSRHVTPCLALPRIIHPNQEQTITNLLEQAKSWGIEKIRIGNLALLPAQQDYTYIADYPLNTFNHLTAKVLAELGVQMLTLSPELTLKQIKTMLGTPTFQKTKAECLVQGPTTLMVSAHCVVGSASCLDDTKLCVSSPCQRGIHGLRDRMEITFPVTCDQYCRSHIHNARDLCLIEHFPILVEAGVTQLRLETQLLTPKQCEAVVKIWCTELSHYLAEPKAFQGKTNKIAEIEEITGNKTTRGHYFRGVLTAK